jgi:biopolymer transport protein TolR
MAFGRFERTPGQTPMSEINVTPLVDVMMVLLVIFIITAPLMVSRLAMDLPKTEGVQASAPPRVVRLALDTQGQVYFDEQSVSVEALARLLHERAAQWAAQGDGSMPEVQLRADEAVPYGRVVEVMGLAQQAGLNRLGFVTEPKSSATRGREARPKP